jgi:hypothetical protein
MSRAGVKVSASQLVNDILHGMYDKAYLANHTVAGGNSSKEVMDAEVVKAISGEYVCCVDSGMQQQVSH